jgi:hypothetical protein
MSSRIKPAKNAPTIGASHFDAAHANKKHAEIAKVNSTPRVLKRPTPRQRRGIMETNRAATRNTSLECN